MRAPRNTAQQFLDVARQHAGDECLLWPHAVGNHGYGVLKTGLPHRLLCEETQGTAPPKAHAAHSCGVRLCVNPRHIRWLTPSENGLEAVAQRGPWKPRKLSDDDVQAIRALAGTMQQRQIARRFAVSESTVSAIINHKTRN